MNILCDQLTPTEAGYYVYKPECGILEPEMIKVVLYPPNSDWGTEHDSYLGIPSLKGIDVKHLKGKFSKKLIIR